MSETKIETTTFVVMGANHWGQGSTVAEAKAAYRRQHPGLRLKDGYAVLTFGPGSEFKGVDALGRYFWDGTPPEVEVHKPKD